MGLAAALGDAEAAVATLDALAEPAGTLTELAGWLVRLRELGRVTRDVTGRVEAALCEAMPGRVVALDGFATLERRSGKNRREWDHRRLAHLLVARVARADEDTGEVLDAETLVERATDELLACAGLSYWKVGELKAREIDPGRFCDESEGRPSVAVTLVGVNGPELV